MRPRRLVSVLICGAVLAAAWLFQPPQARSGKLSLFERLGIPLDRTGTNAD